MNILLVNPRVGSFGSDGLFPHTGLCSLAANSCKGHDVRVVDMAFHTNDEFAALVESFAPDVVGITTTTPGMTNAGELIGIASRKPRTRIVLGGAHITAENARADGVAVIPGEGELAFQAWLEGRTPPASGVVQDLDTLAPPAYDLLPWQRYKGQPILGNRVPIGVISTSRGCPYKCAFCYKAMFGTKIRYHSVEYIVEEFRRWKQRGAREVTITDDAFTTNAARVSAICDKLQQLQLGLAWNCSNGIRANTASVELLRTMRKAGCYRVAFGIESGSQRVLDSLGKNLSLDKVWWAVENAHAAGMEVVGFFILGLPWDTVETMEQTIDLACKLPLDWAQFSVATPYPGTELKAIVDGGPPVRKLSDERFNIYDGDIYFDVPGAFTADDIRRLKQAAYRRFYLRPTLLGRKMLRGTTYRSLMRYAAGAKTFLMSK